MTYWPGTGVVKSEMNAFDWRRTAGALAAYIREIQTKKDAGLLGAKAQQAKK